VILAGVVMLSAASVLMGVVSAPWQLYVCTGVLGAAGVVSLGWVPMGALLSRRFVEGRGRKIATAFSGMGVGVFAMGPATQWLIAQLGWRAATMVLGVLAFALLFPIAWLGVRDVPTPGRGDPAGESRSRPTHVGLGEALRRRAFWALFGAYFMTPLAVFSVFTHQVAFAIDLGFSRMLVASVFGTVGLVSRQGAHSSASSRTAWAGRSRRRCRSGAPPPAPSLSSRSTVIPTSSGSASTRSCSVWASARAGRSSPRWRAISSPAGRSA
jgi:MFS family permease